MTHKRWTITASVLLGLFLAPLVVSSSPQAVTVTLPDDAGDGPAPPSTAERTHALRAMNADATVAALLRGRREIVLVRALEPSVAERAAGPCSTARCIDVTAYLYEGDRVLDVFVDARTWRVVEHRFTRGQPPLNDAEKSRAHVIAERDADVARHLDGARHTHPDLAYPMWRDIAPCDTHRCASVVFPLDDMVRTGVGREATIVVDLSTGTIVERLYLVCRTDCVRGWS
jgi:hypothetical protein